MTDLMSPTVLLWAILGNWLPFTAVFLQENTPHIPNSQLPSKISEHSPVFLVLEVDCCGVLTGGKGTRWAVLLQITPSVF